MRDWKTFEPTGYDLLKNRGKTWLRYRYPAVVGWSIVGLISIAGTALLFNVFAFWLGDSSPWLIPFGQSSPEAVVGTLAAAVATLGIHLTIRESNRVNRFNRGIDAILSCNQRYADLTIIQPDDEDRRVEFSKTSDQTKKYRRQYWGLKADQFDLYLSGLIDRDTMVSWQASTVRALCHYYECQPRAPGGYDIWRSWQMIGRVQNATNPWFMELVHNWMHLAAEMSRAGLEREEREKRFHERIVDALADAESMVRIWRRTSNRGIMTIAFYVAMHGWPLFLRLDTLEAEDRKAVRKALSALRNGKPASSPISLQSLDPPGNVPTLTPGETARAGSIDPEAGGRPERESAFPLLRRVISRIRSMLVLQLTSSLPAKTHPNGIR